MAATMETDAATTKADTTPRGEGGRRGRRGWWRRWAGDQGRVSTLAIVVAVSVVNISHLDIGHRCNRRLVASRPSSSTLAIGVAVSVVDIGQSTPAIVAALV
jgi:hypothetical protein